MIHSDGINKIKKDSTTYYTVGQTFSASSHFEQPESKITTSLYVRPRYVRKPIDVFLCCWNNNSVPMLYPNVYRVWRFALSSNIEFNQLTAHAIYWLVTTKPNISWVLVETKAFMWGGRQANMRCIGDSTINKKMKEIKLINKIR